MSTFSGVKTEMNEISDVSEHVLNDSNLTSSVIDNLGDTNISDSSIDIQLRFEQLLAESALESSALDSSKVNPISSSDKCNLGTSTPRLNPSAFGPLNKPENDELETLFKKYYYEDFIPAENASEKLMADEIAWKKEFDFSGSINEKVDFSCMSGIIGDAEISIRSVAGMDVQPKSKVTAEEYFSMKTNKMGSLEVMLASKERPNFGTEIESPCGNRPRVGFIGEPTEIPPEKPGSANVELNRSASNESTSSEATGELNAGHDESCSALSITSIEDILSKHLQDTPGTIARSILNTKSKKKTPMTQPADSDSESNSSSSTLGEQISALLDKQGENNGREEADWMNVELVQSNFEAYVGSDVNVVLNLQSQTTRWLKCTLSVHKIMYQNKVDTTVQKEMTALMQFPDVTLVGPNQKSVQKTVVTATLPGNFGIYLNVCIEDAVTLTTKNSVLKFDITSKMPKVEILVYGAIVNEMDFGTLPEMCSQLTTLEIRNISDTNLPMTLSLEEVSNAPQVFSLSKEESKDNKRQANSNRKENSLKVGVAFKAPNIKNCPDICNGFVHFMAYLNIALDFSGARPCLVKKLKLKGCVGITQLLMNFESPVEMFSSGPGVANSKALKLKNGGVVPLDLKLIVVDPVTWQMESSGVVTVDNSSLCIPPGKEESLTLIFTPSWVFEQRITRKLVIHVIPHGLLFDIDVQGNMINGDGSQDKEPLSRPSSGLSSQSIVSSSASSTRTITGMPVKTTHKQLVWTTVPIGKSETQVLRLRNEWSTSVKVLLTLLDSSHGFTLLNENGEHMKERKLRLHAKECVSVNVVFLPSKIGVAFGKIIIREAKGGDSSERFAIPLSAYCGTFNLTIRNVSKDKSGSMWINLGPLDNQLNARFTVCNKGNLESFVYFKYVPKGVGALLQDVNVSIEPPKKVIAPGSNEVIQICFELQNDLSFISKEKKEILELGNLYMTCGDEPTRQRIRRIKDKQRGNAGTNNMLELRSLCSAFPGENLLPDLDYLNDPESAVRSLCRTLKQHEIVLTAESYDDRSLAMQTCLVGNQSLIFKSMLPDSTFSENIDENDGANSQTWSIKPSMLTLLVPRFSSGCITIASKLQKDQAFEIVNSENLLSVEPALGIIPKMGEVDVVVTCNVSPTNFGTTSKSTLKVYLENDVKSVTVYIKNCTK